MKRNLVVGLIPSASFVVERKPAIGYQVTSAEGACAEAWKEHALELLESLGQPDPKGPEEYFRWFGPINPSGEFVGVAVKIMPNGEARYHQAWFQVPSRVLQPWLVGLLAMSVVFISLAAGTILGPNFHNYDSSKSSSIKDIGPKSHLPEDWNANLKKSLASSRKVRNKIQTYLSQDGFGADESKSVVDEKRLVKLIADLDKTPPPQETTSLSNFDVHELLKILKVLEGADN